MIVKEININKNAVVNFLKFMRANFMFLLQTEIKMLLGLNENWMPRILKIDGSFFMKNCIIVEE